MTGVQLNLTDVLVVGVPAYIAAIGAAVAAIISALNRSTLKTPSGNNIGHVVERTHDLAAVSLAAIIGQDGPTLSQSVQRLANDPESPVQVDRRKQPNGLPPDGERRHGEED